MDATLLAPATDAFELPMLFLAKRNIRSSLASGALLALAAWLGANLLRLSWPPPTSAPALLAVGLFGLALMLASDAALHTILSIVAAGRYPPAFRALAQVFAQQTPLDATLGALSAGAEELFFRGLLIVGAVQILGMRQIIAVLAASLAFGVAHLMVGRRLWVFSLWAAWEGMLLGLVYVASRSLWAVALAHILHDLVGFWILRRSLRRAEG